MTRSTLVSVMALACACRPSLESSIRADEARRPTSTAELAAQQETLLALQKACLAKRSQVFTDAEVQGIGARSEAVWLRHRATSADARLSRVANVLLARVPARPWQVLVVDEAKVDSFSVPPATVFVTRGLLAAVKSDGALAGVVAHEVAHVVANDALDVLREQNELRCQVQELTKSTVSASNQLMNGEFALDPGDASFVLMANLLVDALTSHGYWVKGQATQEDERLADAQAARWVHDSGFDVREYAAALSTLDGLSVPHPPASKRVEALEAIRQTLPPLPASKPKK